MTIQPTTTIFSFASVNFSGKLDGDTLTISATGAFADKSVGANKTMKLSDLTLGGCSVSNYKLAASGQQTAATATITALRWRRLQRKWSLPPVQTAP